MDSVYRDQLLPIAEKQKGEIACRAVINLKHVLRAKL